MVTPPTHTQKKKHNIGNTPHTHTTYVCWNAMLNTFLFYGGEKTQPIVALTVSKLCKPFFFFPLETTLGFPRDLPLQIITQKNPDWKTLFLRDHLPVMATFSGTFTSTFSCRWTLDKGQALIRDVLPLLYWGGLRSGAPLCVNRLHCTSHLAVSPVAAFKYCMYPCDLMVSLELRPGCFV